MMMILMKKIMMKMKMKMTKTIAKTTNRTNPITKKNSTAHIHPNSQQPARNYRNN